MKGNTLGRSRRSLIVGLGMLAIIILIQCGLGPKRDNESNAEWGFPPAGFTEADLYGTWQASYGGDPRPTDTLIIRQDGTYKQVFHSVTADYHYEGPWNSWWVETLPSGRKFLHLQKMRYCLITDEVCSLDEGGTEGRLMYAPAEGSNIKMIGEVVLLISGVEGMNYPGIEDVPRGIVLFHMRPEIDRGDTFFRLQE